VYTLVRAGEQVALSDTWLKTNQGKGLSKTEVRTDRDGLSVRITPKGKITFQIRYRFDSKPKHVYLGAYPLLSLKDASKESLRLRAKLEQGHNSRMPG